MYKVPKYFLLQMGKKNLQSKAKKTKQNNKSTVMFLLQEFAVTADSGCQVRIVHRYMLHSSSDTSNVINSQLKAQKRSEYIVTDKREKEEEEVTEE